MFTTIMPDYGVSKQDLAVVAVEYLHSPGQAIRHLVYSIGVKRFKQLGRVARTHMTLESFSIRKLPKSSPSSITS